MRLTIHLLGDSVPNEGCSLAVELWKVVVVDTELGEEELIFVRSQGPLKKVRVRVRVRVRVTVRVRVRVRVTVRVSLV